MNDKPNILNICMSIVIAIAFLVGAVGMLTVVKGYRHNGEEGNNEATKRFKSIHGQ